jgi:serine/threonine protein kinase
MLVAALNHENVVKIKAVLADQGIIIMEFIREGSLDRYVHSHRDQLRSV